MQWGTNQDLRPSARHSRRRWGSTSQYFSDTWPHPLSIIQSQLHCHFQLKTKHLHCDFIHSDLSKQPFCSYLVTLMRAQTLNGVGIFMMSVMCFSKLVTYYVWSPGVVLETPKIWFDQHESTMSFFCWQAFKTWPSPAAAAAPEPISCSGMLNEDKWPGCWAWCEDGRCHLGLLFWQLMDGWMCSKAASFKIGGKSTVGCSFPAQEDPLLYSCPFG